MISEDIVTSALDELGLSYKRREVGWAVQPGPRCPQEISLTPTPEGRLRIEGVLTSWDDLGEAERQALAQFLSRAQSHLRFTRCEMQERQAVVRAELCEEEIEAKLSDALAAVPCALARLGREASALLVPELASAYLSFFAPKLETLCANDRI